MSPPRTRSHRFKTRSTSSDSASPQTSSTTGRAESPYRLSLTAVNSGTAGQVVIDGGTTNLGFRNLVNAQDAAVFYGGSGGTQPLLITSNTNQLTNVIKGVTVNLVSASSSPVSLSVTPDPTNVSAQLQNFVTDFNSLVTTINTDTAYNAANNTGGILLGDGTTQQVQEALYNMINTVVQGTGQYQDLADIGITINVNDDPTGGTTLNFDPSTFETAFATDPNAVQDLFSAATIGLGNVINNAMTALTDPVNGAITLENNTLNTEIQQYQDNINSLNAILADQKTYLQNEFNNMEETLATLQSQGTLLSALEQHQTHDNIQRRKLRRLDIIQFVEQLTGRKKSDMNPQAAQKYLKTKVMTATAEQLQMMLFDGAVRSCEQARIALEKKDYERSFQSLTKAQAIVNQLICAPEDRHCARSLQ